jgi:hypothetical protein
VAEPCVRRERLRRWFSLAPRLADANDPLGGRVRLLLSKSSGLSEAGVAHALEHCLEQQPSDAALDQVCARVAESSAAHVLLSANVFTAPFRAIALALAASERVWVRPSRREPLFAELLHEASQGAFELVEELSPRPGEQLWAYGSDATLQNVAARLPTGVLFHPHGHGFGVAVVDAQTLKRDPELAERLAWDVVAFDQRGCLSPRVVIVAAPAAVTCAFAEQLHSALSRLAERIPRGELTDDEAAQARRFVDTMLYATGTVFQGSSHALAVAQPGRRLLLPPTGRHLVLVADVNAATPLVGLAPHVTQVGLACCPELAFELEQHLPHARRSKLGQMQAPPFDGPVDLRVQPFVIDARSRDQ